MDPNFCQNYRGEKVNLVCMFEVLEHIKNPLYGLQFHPESIETENGLRLIKNFLKIKP